MGDVEDGFFFHIGGNNGGSHAAIIVAFAGADANIPIGNADCCQKDVCLFGDIGVDAEGPGEVFIFMTSANKLLDSFNSRRRSNLAGIVSAHAVSDKI